MPIASFRHRLIHRTYQRFSPLIKSKKTASYFTITFSLFSLSFFGLFAIRPTLITAVTLNKSVNDLKKLNIEFENKISNIIRAQAEYEQIRDNLPLVDQALPSLSSFQKLARALEIFASNSNLNINQLQIDNVPVSRLDKPGVLQKYGFSLIGTGDYPSISSYLSHLINWRRIITLSSLEFVREESTASGNLRVSIKGIAYYEP